MARGCMHHIVCTWRTSARTMFVIEDDLMPSLDEQNRALAAPVAKAPYRHGAASLSSSWAKRAALSRSSGR
eukprot:scaffold41021_cov69-Phaeocystis_antarctica.AAC.3